ncbi:hypothetical protein F5X99DRAFT_404109 [Biscogniauxia marginata]|nr:hypothetical protein F5X99DRAFT_404109 [Biscogniauxia marginata]
MSFFDNTVARVADGPDQPARIWTDDCDAMLQILSDVGNGYWLVPTLDGNEDWPLLCCNLKKHTCAFAVARVDGNQEAFKIRGKDVLNFVNCAKRMFKGLPLMKTVIGHAICEEDQTEIEWKVYNPSSVEVDD